MSASRTIYLAEDDLDDQDFLKEALRELDPSVKVVSFSSGLKFLNAIEEIPDENLPELIVLDYNIPELNGSEILNKLGRRSRYANIPKLVWSTSDSQLYRQTCLEGGADAYLVKPSSIRGISEIARTMLTYC